MKFKQLYESILDESQTKHDDLFLVLMLNFKLDLIRSCKIWEQCGKRSTFRHITDTKGVINLINNKDKKLSISAFKTGKIWAGIETDATAVLIVEGDYEIWWPRDAWTYIGDDNMRWMDMLKAKNVTGNVDYSKDLNPIIPTEMVNDYYKELNQYLKKYPSLNQADERPPEHINYMLRSENGSFPPYKHAIYEWVKLNKNDAKKIVKDALKMQLKYLDKYSDIIQKRLMTVYHHRRGEEIKNRMDEAVINNVKIKEIIAMDVDETQDAISHLGTQVNTKGEINKDLALTTLSNTVLGNVLSYTDYKGLFTIYNDYDKFDFMKQIVNKQYSPDLNGMAIKALEDVLKVKYYKNKYFKIG